MAERGGIADFERAEGGPPVRMLAGPIRVDGAPPPTEAAPALGADTDAILRRAGLSAAAIDELRERGTIR